MIIRNSKSHLGDALMILAMMKDGDVYAGTPECNALLSENVKTVPVEHITYWDVDVSNVIYPTFNVYAKRLNMKWDGKPASLKLSDDEVKLTKLPSKGKRKIGVCATSRDFHRSYPHHKALVKLLNDEYDVYVFGREYLPIRHLMSKVSQMDKMVSVDTGIAHIGGCLGIPLIIIEGPTDCKKLYSIYEDVRYVSTDRDGCERKPCIDKTCKYANCMYLIYPRDVFTGLKPKKSGIAVCRMKGLGDLIMIIPLLYSLKRAFPDIPLIVITSPGGKYMLTSVDCIDEIEVSDYKHASSGLPSLPHESFSYTHPINLINAVDFGNICFTNNRPDNFIKVSSDKLDTSLALDDNFLIPDFPIVPKKQEHFIKRHSIPPKLKIGCQLTSMGKTRNLALSNWLELFRVAPSDWCFIAFSDKALQLVNVDNVIDTTGKLTVEEFVCGVSLCDVFICADSVGMHIGPRVNVPVVLLSGSTNVEYHTKYNKDWLVHPIYAQPMLDCSPCFDWQIGNDCYNRAGIPWCLNRIKTEQILNAIKDILANGYSSKIQNQVCL